MPRGGGVKLYLRASFQPQIQIYLFFKHPPNKLPKHQTDTKTLTSTLSLSLFSIILVKVSQTHRYKS
jgi:hypothetical protein